GKFFREIWPKTWDPQIRIDDYARFGVQVQVLSTVPVMFSYWAKPNQALELHAALNDHMATTVRDYPRHYAGIGTVPMQSPRLAVQELERCIRSEEHTSELQSREKRVCRRLLEKKKTAGREADIGEE